jgi:hypothetical protein
MNPSSVIVFQIDVDRIAFEPPECDSRISILAIRLVFCTLSRRQSAILTRGQIYKKYYAG